MVLLVALLAACALFPVAAQAKLTGAVWTTLPDGTAVDHNVYDAMQDVYLNGGPYHESGAWVPDGDYYFMVTDPPGKVLLSQDTVDHRMIRIEGGKVLNPDPVPPYTDHLVGIDLMRPGNYTIQLMPYSASKNGEYKLWLTRVEDYDPGDPGAKFGFIPSCSKTDNFRVRRGRAMIFGHKWEDDDEDGLLDPTDGNGVWDPGELPLSGWQIDLYQKGKNGNWVLVGSSFTDSGDGSYVFFLTQAGDYKIVEVLQANWEQTYPLPLGYHLVTITKGDLNAKAEKGPYDFGNWTGGPPPAGDIGGTKFSDNDNSGGLTPGDTPIEGWSVTITAGTIDSNGDFVPADPQPLDAFGDQGPWTVLTGPDGVWYKAGLLLAYEYQVQEEHWAGWNQTAPSNEALSANVFAKSGSWYILIVPTDPARLETYFGNYHPGGGQILVFKFEDVNANGVYDPDPITNPGERPIQWFVRLYNEAGTQMLDYGWTDATTGLLLFPTPDRYVGRPSTTLPFGNYMVAEAYGGVDWTPTTPSIVVVGSELVVDPLDPTVVFGNHYFPCP